ncbi:CinA family protein [Rhodococcus sp. ARC_M6]|uniref:CinA family protein n=1 Tax=Rhodococcus sp. ARC_M6 TaxID=2928852 RepID=UPI001FB30FC8|nr:CinA family protein [Rhodococcus sp. ARC_M6]MCJ0905911.1 CinA family protein [Rhodococcus sp. ARC_M6]
MSDDPLQDLPTDADLDALCEQLAVMAQERGLTVATAESLTSGNIAARLGKASDAGSWFSGGVVAYSRAVKHSVLHVPDGSVVCEEAARVMARSVATLMGASLALSVTGEGGPHPQESEPPGTVWFGIVDHGTAETEKHVFSGTPESVLTATVEHAIRLLVRHASPQTNCETTAR